MIEAGVENPAVLTAWDSLTTNWDLFEEFVHSVPNFTLYIHSRKREYEAEREWSHYTTATSALQRP